MCADSIVLDSFAGSGTTGHAVMALNKADGGNRRYILVEMDQNIARNVTAERLKRVANGYTNAKGQKIEGLGGGFSFATLGEPLFDERGNIRTTVKFAELARHVHFIETGEPMAKQAKANSPLIGTYKRTAIYLLYNGILKDKSPDGGNVLTTSILAHLPKHDGPKVIYGTACRLGAERLRREQIIFKQLPYRLRVGAR
jgi:adenine-specific DNA-methyltransferase